MSEMHPAMRRRRAAPTPAVRWISIVIALVVVVGAVWLTVILVQQARDQRFLDALDADPTTTIGELPDEQLLVSREAYCEDIARGATVEEVIADAGVQPASAGITYAEYKANIRALYNAASVAC